MSKTSAATEAAISECKAMTTLLKEAIAKRAATQKTYDDLMVEYLRRKGNYDSAAALYSQRCSGSCARGGVQRYGCDPMCTNMNLNVAPNKPETPVYPSLGEFVCSICAQSVDISGTAGRDIVLEEKAINQQMSCTASAESAAATAAATAAAATAAKATTVPATTVQTITTSKTPTTKVQTSIPTTTATTTSSKKKYLIIGFVALMFIIVIIAVAYAFATSADDGESAEDVTPSAPPFNPQMQGFA